MIWYYIFFFLICFFVVIQQNYAFKFKLSNASIIFFSFIFILLVVIRPSNLPDYGAYYDFYTHSNPVHENFEFFSHLIRNISPSWNFFLFLFAFISIILKFYAIKINSDKHIFAILTYISTTLVLHDFIQIRASCAIGIIWVALFYFNERKYFQYFILIILASLFHVSAIIFFPLFFLKSKKFNKLFWIGLIFISYFFAIFNIDLIHYLLLFLGEFGYIGKKLTTYYELAQVSTLTQGYVNIFSIHQILKIFLIIILLSNINKLNDKTKLFFKIYILGCCCLPLFHNVTAIAMRFAELLTSVVVFLLPEILTLFRKRSFGYVMFLFYIMAFYFLNVIYPNYFM